MNSDSNDSAKDHFLDPAMKIVKVAGKNLGARKTARKRRIQIEQPEPGGLNITPIKKTNHRERVRKPKVVSEDEYGEAWEMEMRAKIQQNEDLHLCILRYEVGN